MHTNEYALETIARARLEELRHAAERAHYARITKTTPGRGTALRDAVRWLRGRLGSRDGVLSPSTTSA